MNKITGEHAIQKAIEKRVNRESFIIGLVLVGGLFIGLIY